MRSHFPSKQLCSLLTAAALTLSLGLTGFAAGNAASDLETDSSELSLSPQTADDPQYWAEYRKQIGQSGQLSQDAGNTPALFSADTFQYTSPYTEKTYTITGEEEQLALGVDVSYYQDEIDWEAARADGVEFAFIRAAYRGSAAAGTLVTDTQFYNNLAAARAQGVKVGIYIYSQAITVDEAREEAEYVLSLIEGYRLELPIVFDQEFAEAKEGGFTGRLYNAYSAAEDKVTFLTDLACAFCDAIAEAGYTPMVYGSTSHINERMDITRLSDPVWVAQYNTKVTLDGEYAFWQYSSSGAVEGINGNTDCDFSVNPAYLDCPNPSDTGSFSRIIITPESYPTGTISAAPFTLTGSIISALPLVSVSAALIDADGNEVQSFTDQTTATEYPIKGSPIDQNLKFSALAPGSYLLRYTATDESGAEEIWESELFTVEAESSVLSQITISPDSYPTGNLTAKPFTLTGTITSALPLVTVTGSVFRADDTLILTCSEDTTATVFSIKGSKIDNGLKFSSLTGGYYYLTYTAVDTNGTEETWRSDIFAVADAALFPDVLDPQTWYYGYAYKAASLGLIAGVPDDGALLFCPNDVLTRSQIVCMLYNMAGSPDVEDGAHPFTDAPAGWYQTQLTWAYQQGVVSGTGATTFSPNDPVTREQLATILYNYSKAEPVSSDPLTGYTDPDQVSDWALPGVRWCVSNEILTSTSTAELTFSPKTNATRAQAAVLLSKYMEEFN